ncbi:hypothetical protein BH09PSE5_BH09PSE5_08640 [soil metagenome]
MDQRRALTAVRKGYLALSSAVSQLSKDFTTQELAPYYVRLGQMRRSLDDMLQLIDDDQRAMDQRWPSHPARVPEDALRSLAERVYISRLDLTLEKATTLLNQQRARVAEYQRRGVVPTTSQALLDNMVRSVELLHWQRALMEWANRDATVPLRDLQPSSHAPAPDCLLNLICLELQTIKGQGVAANQQTNEAVRRAVRKVAGRQ